MEPITTHDAHTTESIEFTGDQWEVASFEKHLNEVLESEAFRGSHRSARFLNYIVRHAIAGDVDSLKERAIGIDIFGRPPGYDTGADAIVRVTASDVRKRLTQHYGRPGLVTEYRISLPAGSYVPKITRSPRPRTEGQLETVNERFLELASTKGPVAQPARKNRFEFLRFPLAVILVSVLNLAVFVAFWNRSHRPESLTVLPWSSIFGSSRMTQIVTSDPNIAEIEGFTGGQISLSDYANRRYIPNPTRLTSEQLNFCTNILRGDKASVVDTPIVMAIGQLAQATSSKISVHGARNIQFSDIQTDANIVLLGSPRSNPWSNLYNDRLNFRFEYDPKTEQEVIANAHPRPGEPALLVETAPGWKTGRSYAIVAFLQNLEQNGQVLLLAGETAEGTAAAGKLVTDLPRLDAVLKKCGIRQSGQEHFEILLQLDAMAGSPSNVDVVACRVF